MATRLVVTLALALAVVGCGGGDAERWPGPPREGADGTLAVAGFNDHLADSDEPFARSPLLAAAEFLRLDRIHARATELTARGPGEGPGLTAVIATLDGLLDDSVAAKRYTLEFEPTSDGRLRLDSARWSQRCHRGRGHQDFSAELCV